MHWTDTCNNIYKPDTARDICSQIIRTRSKIDTIFEAAAEANRLLFDQVTEKITGLNPRLKYQNNSRSWKRR